MDNSKLYRAVFKREMPCIDTNNTQTVLVNCGWGKERYGMLLAEMEARVGRNWYNELEIDGDMGDFELARKVSNAVNVNLNNHFLLLLDHSACSAPGEAAFIRRIIGALNENVTTANMKVSAVMILGETTDITKLNREICDVLDHRNIDVFLYNELEDTKELVISACMGVVIAACYDRECNLSGFKSLTVSEIDRRPGFGPETEIGGKIDRREVSHLSWMAVSCKISDESNDYLAKAFRQLVEEGMVTVDQRFFAEAADAFYGDRFKHAAVDDGCLLQAVNRIPRVTKQVIDHDQIKLEQYFSEQYGFDGAMAVDLSLKITMAKNLNVSDNPVEDIKKALDFIHKRLRRLGSKDLYQYILDSLAAYKAEMVRDCENKEESLREALSRSTSNPRQALVEYVRQYQDLFRLQKKIEFWTNVEANFVKEEWANYHAESVQIARELESLKAQLVQSVGNRIDRIFEDLSDRRFTAYELIRPEECEELCTLLEQGARAYSSAPRGAQHMDELKWLLRLNQHPSFRRETAVSFVTNDRGYQVDLECRCGKYLISDR